VTETAVGGTYTLVVEVREATTTTVGALGQVHLAPGWYAYTGSALGAGGFERVRRHRELAAGERDTRHWHVDYLLGAAESRVDCVVRSAGLDAECLVARAVDGDPVPGFGCSDCDCDSHLAYAPERARLLWSVQRAHERARQEGAVAAGE
jgi:Uri superfamily endonuclease